MPDPFRHHPELRDRIADPRGSYFREFLPADLDARMAERGLPPDWRYSDAEREAGRRRALAGRPAGDLWVFAYGSLMWDPAILFEEVRHAHVATHARRFILLDTLGARGTPERPGLMAALDAGPGCDGLAFRIASDRVEAETEILWRRERIARGYVEAFIEARLSDATVTALTFVADRAAEPIHPDLSRAEQVRCIATGKGFRGSSLDYLRNLKDHFDTLGIVDREVDFLLAEAERSLRGG